MTIHRRFICFVLLGASLSWSASRTIAALEHGDRAVIVTVGSSRVAPESSRWAALMDSALNVRFPGRVSVDNKGVSGKQFESILSDFISSLDVAKPPEAVFVELQLTEYNKTDLQNYPDSMSYYVEHLRMALKRGRDLAPGCDIVLWLPYRICMRLKDFAWQIAFLDTARAIAAADSIRVADNWRAFEHVCEGYPCCADYSRFLYDGSHATDAGAAIVCAEALRALYDLPPDTTAPAATPASVSARSVGSAAVMVSWTAIDDSADRQNGIAGYSINRGDGFSAVCNGRLSTALLDTQVSELSTYSYTVRPFNNQIIWGPQSGPSMASTPVDRDPPKLCRAFCYPGSRFITLLFDEPLDSSNTSAVSSFSITGASARVVRAMLQPDLSSIVLETDGVPSEKNASISVTHLRDRSRSANIMTTSQSSSIAVGGVDPLLYYTMAQITYFSDSRLSPVAMVRDNPPLLIDLSDSCGWSLQQDINVIIVKQGLIAVRSPGHYRFYVETTADSARFSVGASPTIKLAGIGAADSLDADLPSGFAPLLLAAVNYARHDYASTASLWWSGPGFGRSRIPDSLLFRFSGDSATAGFHGRILSPVSGQALRPGDSLIVAWNQDGGIPLFQLVFEIRYDPASKWRQMLPQSIASDIGHFMWRVPDSVAGVALSADSACIRGFEYNHNGTTMLSPFFSISSSNSLRPDGRGAALKNRLSIRIRPNGRVGFIFFAVRPGKLFIADMRGRIVAAAPAAAGRNSINLLLPKGVYFYRMAGTHSTASGKIVVTAPAE